MDGFDELKKPTNLYEANKFKQYNCKVITTSRREYLNAYGDDYIKHFRVDDYGANTEEGKLWNYAIPRLDFV